MTASPTFGTLLRQLRKRAGMTQGDLAAAVGYSVSFISDLEQNRRLPAVAVVLQQFVPALGLQEEAGFAAHLVELAAVARGERPSTMVTVQRKTQLTVTDTFTFRSNRLPAPPTELIGREQEVKTLCNRLQGHSGRLLTLVGAPGVGKTRLGLAVAGHLEPLFKDGARFVPLAAVIDPDFVATSIANELELADTGQQSPEQRLIHGLRQKELLLLLDNFEHIIAAAPLLAALLAACPGVYLLVTSRERLHLRAEQRFLVPPLDLAFAVALFVQRAQAVDPGFERTAENQPILEKICQRLDCLPLAIELIAARIDLFSPQSMLTRLQAHALDLLADNAQDAPAHQQTLRKAIQYSYDLLAERERVLFRTLGVFVDGFDLEAVAHFGFSGEALQALINKSLVHLPVRQVAAGSTGEGERCFLLLEMLREYALEQLNAHQEIAETKQHYAAYYLELLERSEHEIRDKQFGAWLGRLESEHNNLRAALAWAIAQEDGTTALRLCGVLHWFWAWHGHCQEGKTWLEKSLAVSADAPLTVRAKAFSAAGHMHHILGNHAQAQTWVEKSLTIYQTINDQRNVAEMSLQLAGIIRKQHRYTQAKFFYEQSLKIFQTLGEHGRPGVHIGLGNLAMNLGDYGQARTHYEQALLGQRASGDKLGIAEVLPRLALQAFHQGDYSRASVCCEELLALAQELGDQESEVNAYNQLGSIAIQQGELAQATRYLTQSFTSAQELNYPPLLASVLANQGNLAMAQVDFVQAQRCFCQSLQVVHQLADPVEIANGLESLAGVAGAQADVDRATRLLGAAASLRQGIGAPLPASEQTRHDQLMAETCSQLGETVYASLYAEGFAMSTDQAVAFALAQLGAPK